MPDPAAMLQQILGEADNLIRRRLNESDFEVPHLVVAVMPDGEVVLRSNVSADALRSFAEDLENVADELTAAGRPDASIAGRPQSHRAQAAAFTKYRTTSR